MTEFQRELQQCQESAQLGSQLARDSFDKMKFAIAEEKEKLRAADQQQQSTARLENDPHFRDQLREIETLERDTISRVEHNISELDKQLGEFTIVLYGRTMAGKSTLMEILTEGNGASIGKGAQRTTRDVRDYHWNGLKIYDVPGICSFEGDVDDRLALEAAKTADLALFLITNDGVQHDEAERLAELKALGKPVLGIVNVKQTLTPDRNNVRRKIDLKQIERKLNNRADIDSIVEQLRQFSPDNSFDDIPFVYAHLQSAYFAQRENDPSLYQLSNFEAVKQFILEKVQRDGKFIRIKTFIDAVARPMQQAIATLYGQSSETCHTIVEYNKRIEKLIDWREKFLERTQSEFNQFQEGLIVQFNDTIERFVNNHYDDSDAESAWRTAIKRIDIESQCQKFISNLSEEATTQMRKFSDDLTQDLKFSAIKIEVPSLPRTDLTDYGDGIRTVAPLLLLTPVGWAGAIAAGIFSFLFDSREDKIREQKSKMRASLRGMRDEILPKIGDKMIDMMNAEVLNKQIDGFRDILIDMVESLRRLAYGQNRVADIINSQYNDINFVLITSAINYINDTSPFNEVSTARVVGDEFLFISTDRMSEQTRQKLSELLGEKLTTFHVSQENYWDGVIEQLEQGVLQSGFSFPKIIDEDYGSMHVIVLPKEFRGSKQMQLVQQVMYSPAVY